MDRQTQSCQHGDGGEKIPTSVRMDMKDSKDGHQQGQIDTHFGCFQILKVQMTVLYGLYTPRNEWSLGGSY